MKALTEELLTTVRSGSKVNVVHDVVAYAAEQSEQARHLTNKVSNLNRYRRWVSECPIFEKRWLTAPAVGTKTAAGT